jgi:hypothetical protein
MQFEIPPDDLPPPERRAELQDMIDSLREYARKELNALGTCVSGFHRNPARDQWVPDTEAAGEARGVARRTSGLNGTARR